MKLEYVMSGCNGLQVLSEYCMNDPLYRDVVCQNLQRLNQSNPDHYFSVLFNALTEKSLGKRMKENVSSSIYKIHADSGGLQEITLGKKIEDKNKIYQTQIDFSDVAMSFDDVPVVLPQGSAFINSSGSKMFSLAKLKESAKASGINLRNQLRYFQEKEAQGKIFLILQGNSFETYQIWLDTIWEVIKDEDLSYIGGISSGAAALGMGPLEDFDRAYYTYHLQYPEGLPKDHVHVLGVGSIFRLLPFMLLPKARQSHVSYDSTTFSKAMFIGMYYDKGTLRQFTQDKRFSAQQLVKSYNPILEKYKFTPLEEEMIYRFEVCSGETTRELMLKEGLYLKFVESRLSYVSAMVLQFMEECDAVLKYGPSVLSHSVRDKWIIVAENYAKIQDAYDYDKWKREFGIYLPSNRVPCFEKSQVFNLI